VIYFVQSPSGGPIKIGQTIRLSLCLAQLLAEHGQLVVLAVLDGSYPEENALHRRFASLRVRGEWFQPGADLLDFIRQNGRPWDAADEEQRPGYPIFARIRQEIGDALERFLKSQRLRPALSSVLKVALEDFLAAEGFPVPPPEPKEGVAK
jgi:hypothetical protein